MTFIEKLRGEFIDIIEWIDDKRHTLVWRFPRYHNEIKYAAQLIVRPGQMAIFVHQGKLADVFEPGRYRLDTKCLPVLSTLAGWKYGFNSPFRAEVYFVNTTKITDLKWGTPNPVIVRDPDFGPLRIRAFGTYVLRATDPRALLQQLVGTDENFQADEVTELVRSIISHSFADVVAAAEIPIVDLASNYASLSESVRAQVVQRVDDEYGLDVPQLFIVNISLPAEVEQALDTRSSMSVIGDMATFHQYQLGQAMPIAAANPAGGVAGAGVGLGMGLAVASQMAGPSVANPGPLAPPPPPAVSVWHVAENGRTLGPFTWEQLRDAAGMGSFRPETLVWQQGMAGWTPAREVGPFAGLFDVPPPPPPGA